MQIWNTAAKGSATSFCGNNLQQNMLEIYFYNQLALNYSHAE
jgi:hypothetical protein